MKQINDISDIDEIDLRKIDLNLLTIFAALMRECNVTRAADRLGLSQSAVSAALGRLRLLYKDPLLTRTQAGMKPTARAVILYPQVCAALNAIGQTFTNGAPGRDKLPPVIRMGLSDDFELAFGTELVTLFSEQLPGCRLVFQQTNSRRVCTDLIDGRIDLSLTGGGVTGTQLKRQTLGHSDYACLYDPAHREGQAPLSLAEYVARPHILVSYDGLSGAVDDALQELEKKRVLLTSTSHYGALAYLLENTAAIATIPRHVATAISQNSRLAVIACPVSLPGYSIDLGWHHSTGRIAGLTMARELIAARLARALSDAGI